MLATKFNPRGMVMCRKCWIQKAKVKFFVSSPKLNELTDCDEDQRIDISKIFAKNIHRDVSLLYSLIGKDKRVSITTFTCKLCENKLDFAKFGGWQFERHASEVGYIKWIMF